MKIFITGTTGFIGRSLVEYYERLGDIVRGFTRDENLFLTLDEFKPDVIINCAGEIYNDRTMFDTNIKMVYHILEWMRENDHVKLIQIGSSAEYGPMTRASAETDRINPVNMYEASKGAATLLCQGYAHEYGLKTSVARVYSAYGPYERPHRLFPRLYRAFFENQEMTLYDGVHDFIYIDDFVRGIDMLVKTDTPTGEIVNFGSGVQHTNLEVLELFKNITGLSPNIKYENRMNKAFESTIWCCNTDYLTNTYNFKLQYDLESGIKDFIKKMKENNDI